MDLSNTFDFVPHDLQNQPPRGVLKKSCSENMQQIYRKTPLLKCDFNKVALHFIEIVLQHGYFPVNLLHIFRTPFLKNTSGLLLLDILIGKHAAYGINGNLFTHLSNRKQCTHINKVISNFQTNISRVPQITIRKISYSLVSFSTAFLFH